MKGHGRWELMTSEKLLLTTKLIRATVMEKLNSHIFIRMVFSSQENCFLACWQVERHEFPVSQ